MRAALKFEDSSQGGGGQVDAARRPPQVSEGAVRVMSKACEIMCKDLAKRGELVQTECKTKKKRSVPHIPPLLLSSSSPLLLLPLPSCYSSSCSPLVSFCNPLALNARLPVPCHIQLLLYILSLFAKPQNHPTPALHLVIVCRASDVWWDFSQAEGWWDFDSQGDPKVRLL